MSHEHHLLVTGRLAERALREIVDELNEREGFHGSVHVLPITIAALMTPKWIARHLEIPDGVTRLVIPGYASGDIEPLETAVNLPVECGPVDLRQLPEYFGHRPDRSGFGAYDIEILARVPANVRHDDALVEAASRLVSEGADRLVLGPHSSDSAQLAGQVARLRDEGLAVAVADALPDAWQAVLAAGADRLLGVSPEHVDLAGELGVPFDVAVDRGMEWDALERLVERLDGEAHPYRIQIRLASIGLGLADDLAWIGEARRRWPKSRFLVDLASTVESAGVDTAGIHLLLLGLCQEMGIDGVVTSSDVNAARSAVRECHLARRLVHFARNRALPIAELEPELLMLRDRRLLEHGPEGLDRLTALIQDPSPRIVAEGGKLHAIQSGERLESDDPYDLFDQLQHHCSRPITTDQAFYLGYEMSKAMVALALSKNYRQDEALDWGLLTVRELTRLERRALRMARENPGSRWDEECPDARNDS